MKLNLLTVEDGLNNTGFRKLAAYTRKLYPETGVHYVMTGNQRSFRQHLMMRRGSDPAAQDLARIAERVADADVVGVSSMTPYADLSAQIIAEVRRRNPQAYVVWGGTHGIIEPEDAVQHADAVCTGEGEFAFEKLLDALDRGADPDATPGFWFNTEGGVVRNTNLPLMTAEQLSDLPLPLYQEGEQLFRPGRGFSPITPADFVRYNGLSYKTVWSIGCPFRCTYCGNTKFIDYDKKYRIIRHSTPETIVGEVETAIRKHPHLSTVIFDDDSFMALPPRVMREFAALFRERIGLPFVVTGLIPNYVREEKISLLVSAGMNRVRMGIQSGSQAILEFYDRPTPVARIRQSCDILNRHRDQMVPPAFDIILDNPIETREDNLATLDLLYGMPRPYTLNLYSLRVIPNTRLAQQLEERGIDVDDIRSSYTRPRATLSNILVHAIASCPIPERLFRWLRKKAQPSVAPQRRYPLLMLIVRFFYLAKHAADHLLSLNLTVLSGWPIYVLWKLGIVGLWQRFVVRRRIARLTGPIDQVRGSVPAAATARELRAGTGR